jgi:predicted nucleotidyltransferase
MRPSEALSRHRARILEIAFSHHVSNVRVFGSVSRGEDGPDSDLDLLVDPTAQTTLMGIGAIRYELKNLLGIEVDVLTPNSLPPHYRDQVLREAVPV